MDPLGDAPYEPSSSEAPAGAVTAGDASAADGFTVTCASLDAWRQVAEWAAEEGWNPGRGDTACFHPTDPAGFFIGRLGTEPVSAISVVNYSPEYAFLGYYLVHPDHRGRGLGLATWRAAVPHAGSRTIGLDAVPAQQGNYERSGFAAVRRTIRYTGHPGSSDLSGGPAAAASVVLATEAHLDAINGYDRQCFPAERRAFLSRWLTTDGHTAYVCLRDGNVTGYGVCRAARSGRRIGPLFADTAEEAEALFDALTARLAPDEEVSVDVPEPHHAANALAAARGLTPGFETARMYTGPVPPTREERVFGVTSLELG